MNPRWWPIGFAILMLLGCGTKQTVKQTAFIEATPDLPRFHFVKVVSGKLHAAGTNLLANMTSKDSPVRISGQYLDAQSLKSGSTNIGSDLLLAVDEGKPVMVRPVSVGSDKYGYYAGPKGFYYRKRGDQKLRCLSREYFWSAVLKDDAIYGTKSNGDGSSKLVKFGPEVPEAILADNVVGNVSYVGPNEEIVVATMNSVGVKLPGKPYRLVPRTSRAELLIAKGQTFMIGLAWDGQFVTPAIWNSDLKPVRLRDLCPGLEKAIKPYDQCAWMDVWVDQDGTISFMIEGWNRIGQNTFADPVAFTYVVKLDS